MRTVVVSVELRVPFTLVKNLKRAKNLILKISEIIEWLARPLKRVQEVGPHHRPLCESKWNKAQRFNDELQRRM